LNAHVRRGDSEAELKVAVLITRCSSVSDCRVPKELSYRVQSMPIGIAMFERAKYTLVVWVIIGAAKNLLAVCLGSKGEKQMSNLTLRVATLLVTSTLLACGLHAQVTSRIGGYVRDASGAIVPNAKVTAVSAKQGLTRTTNSNTTGYYEFVAIPAGTYDITVESTGFQNQTQNGVELQANQNLRLDVQLRVGDVREEVSVSSSATLVNTATATLAATVDTRRVLDLPLNGRNIMSLTQILPGVTDVVATETMANTRSGPVLVVNGSRQVDNNFMLDGGNWTNWAQSTGMNFPPPDAIAEVQIQTQQFDSQYGNSAGSQVVVTSKSGTNALHGSAWEFLRNRDLNARSFFQTVRPFDTENQFGAAAG